MLSLVRRLFRGTGHGPEGQAREPLFHPPKGPLEVTERIDEIDLAHERDRKTRTARAVVSALSLAGLSGNGALTGGSDPIMRISAWSAQDHYER